MIGVSVVQTTYLFLNLYVNPPPVPTAPGVILGWGGQGKGAINRFTATVIRITDFKGLDPGQC